MERSVKFFSSVKMCLQAARRALAASPALLLAVSQWYSGLGSNLGARAFTLATTGNRICPLLPIGVNWVRVGVILQLQTGGRGAGALPQHRCAVPRIWGGHHGRAHPGRARAALHVWRRAGTILLIILPPCPQFQHRLSSNIEQGDCE